MSQRIPSSSRPSVCSAGGAASDSFGVVGLDIGLGADGEAVDHGCPPLGEDPLPVGVADGDEAIREGPGDGRPRPRAVFAGDPVEARDTVRAGQCRRDDPLGTCRVEPRGQRCPRRIDRRLIAVGAGASRPILLGSGDLGVGEGWFVDVDVHVVWVDPHPQMGRRLRWREEAGLDAHRQQGDRNVGRQSGDSVGELREGGRRRSCRARHRSPRRSPPTRRRRRRAGPGRRHDRSPPPSSTPIAVSSSARRARVARNVLKVATSGTAWPQQVAGVDDDAHRVLERDRRLLGSVAAPRQICPTPGWRGHRRWRG